ncbi:GTP pyrophosphokinase [Paenibacillus antibioticophila]|uniref:GTP pyrophosphokinase n=1 Tax=Paenibacillus antibioticophila TaxID=1274374 RepID=UPI0006779557|nr:hypothetical protein [Paenibacillus antibioticophila]
MKKNSKKSRTEEIIQEYDNIRPIYVQLTTKITRLLEDLLHVNHIKYHAIESRTKETSSFREKIIRKSEKYINPINEITDFTGIRLITYFVDEVDKISEIIKDEFDIDFENSIDKGNLLNDNEFGYRSVHYVVTLSNKRSVLPEWAHLTNRKFEIQIRTVLQHAWAGISHTLQYKHETEVPTSLKRQLFRLAGLFELADEEFVDIKDQHFKIASQVSNTDQQAINDEINYHTIQRFLYESKLVKDIQNKANKIGFIFENPYEEEEEEDDKFDSMIIIYCDIAEIKTIKQLEDELRKSYELSIYFLRKQREEMGGEWIVSNSFLICLIIIFLHYNKFTLDKLQTLGWHTQNAKRILEVTKNFLKDHREEGDIA